jgi:hypothetical protein
MPRAAKPLVFGDSPVEVLPQKDMIDNYKELL